MSITIRQIHPVFVGGVSGVDLRQPLTAEEAAAIEAGMDRHAVLVFHDQDITDEQQLAFSRNFGAIERAVGGNVTRDEDRRLSFDMADISNLDKDNKVMARDDRRRMFNLGNELWHSDSSYRVIPAKFSLLSARAIPDAGGNTELADMRAAPASGRKSLFLASHAGAIVGWPVPEARAFLRELTEHATQRQFVHAHRWRRHDLVMWDNRATMHRARRYDHTQVRDMRRTTIAGSAPTAEQVRAA